MNAHTLAVVTSMLLFVISHSDTALCDVYYIVPTDSDPCSMDSCLTLSQFAGNITDLKSASNNITLFVIGGGHSLDKEISLSNMDEFSILSINDLITNSVISCSTDTAHFSLTFISQIHMHGIEFVGCNGNIFRMVRQASIVNSQFVNSSGTALTILNTNVSMESASFISNTKGKYKNVLESVQYLQMIFGILSAKNSISIGGALIVTNSTLVCDSCQFSGNSANTGGAIFSDSSSNITITNSNFTSNHALDCENSLCLGGALYIDETADTTIIYNSVFQNNTSNQYGGVVVIAKTSHVSYDVSNTTVGNESNRDISLSIETSTFLNNKAMLAGGAVYLYNGSTAIYDSTFDYNEAGTMGGAIASNESSFVLLKTNHFAFNRAKLGGGVVSIHQHSTAHVDNCSVEHNTVRGNGGAVYEELKSTAIFQRSKFINNYAGGDRGGVVMINTNSKARINDSSFFNNSASNSGGVLYAQMTSSVIIQKSCFVNNKAGRDGAVVVLFGSSISLVIQVNFTRNQAGIKGGVITARNLSSVTVRNSIFSHNFAGFYGGAVHIKDSTVALIKDSQFDHNTALDGGAINVYSMCSIKVYRTIFSDNTANITGGVISSKLDCTSTITDSNFCNNFANDIGAVVYSEDRTNITFYMSNFTNNSAIYGAVVAVRRNCVLSINGSLVGSNTARADGGFLYSRSNSKAVISNSLFRSNRARNNGIVLASDASNIVISTSNFTENMAGHDGAVLYVHDRSSAIIKTCNITSNWANNSGGVIYTRRHCCVNISNGNFHNNTAENAGGVVCAQGDSEVNIEGSTFADNKADYGGVARVYFKSKINITDCHFRNNTAHIGGGTVASYKYSVITIQSSEFMLNTASFGGVLIAYQSSKVSVDNASCLYNTAKSGGVTRITQGSTMNITGSSFTYNTAEVGGALSSQRGVLNFEKCHLEHNRARLNGGAVYTEDGSTMSIHTVTFSNNTAESNGGAIALTDSSITILEYCTFTSNGANTYGGAINLQNSSISIFNAVFKYSDAGRSGGVVHAKNASMNISTCLFIYNSASKKGGSMYVHMNSSLSVVSSTFMNNTASDAGGALYLSQTSWSTIDNSTFHNNKAKEHGGAILASMRAVVNISRIDIRQNTANMGAGLAIIQNSSVSFDSPITITNTVTFDKRNQVCENMANIGGGIFLCDSILYFMMNTTICHNEASTFGGGLSALDSHIVIGSLVLFDSNQAMQGGGISLAVSKLYHIVADKEMPLAFDIKFIMNRAGDGGALYIDDKKDNATCSGGQFAGGCFFQNVTKSLNFFFNGNIAKHRGHNLFGGLLDRCTVISDITPTEFKSSGTVRFKEISNIRNLSTVTSEPVRVCPCINHIPDCSRSTDSVSVKQGNTFIVQGSAVDQVNQSVSATIHSNLKDVSLAQNQTVRRIDSSCSDLDYQVLFPSVSQVYQLTISADGPCSNIGISGLRVDIKVLECLCPPGFMREELSTKCLCVCDKQDRIFSAYIRECNFSVGSVIRKGLFWITYLNDSLSGNNSSSRYFIYPYCPLGYCQSPSKSVAVDLRQPNGSDAQCAHNRRGILCGRCRPDFSLSLGSSKCISCPRNWHVQLTIIITASSFAGILLVFILLVFNVIVAVGSINSIIFYANIIYANKNIFFNHWQLELTFASVFVSWLNLDIGFDVCFFDGMDLYAKTWLQLAFSMYIFFLVVMIIWISSYSSRISNLLGKRHPVATLATLILLSYTKLLETVIKSFSFVSLSYPNGTTTTNWLPDANVEYKEWKLILLVCSASIILIFGLLYTVIIFSWQWLLRYSRSKLFKWVGNQKLHLFIDTYHIPHTTNHRYWTGLLLLVRVTIYFISAFSASINPRITLLSTATIICCLFLYKTALMIRVYKNWLLNAMESFSFFNIAIFVFFTWYTFDDPNNTDKELLQTIIAYISVAVMLFLFLLIILFHVYRYGNAKVYKLLHNTKLIGKIRHQISFTHNENWCASSQGNIYRLFDVIDNPREDDDDADGNDHGSPFVQLPTRSTVSLTDPDSNEPLIMESHPCRKGDSISTL